MMIIMIIGDPRFLFASPILDASKPRNFLFAPPLARDKSIVKTRQTLDLIASGPGLVWTCFCVHNSQTKYRLILST